MGMSKKDEAADFLKSSIDIGRIVPSGDLTESQIVEARANNMFFVDDQGYGYAIVPWDLTTIRDRHRERIMRPYNDY